MIDPFKTKVINRLKKAKGQIDGLMGMIENDKYCMDVLTQSLEAYTSDGIPPEQKGFLESQVNSLEWIVDYFEGEAESMRMKQIEEHEKRQDLQRVRNYSPLKRGITFIWVIFWATSH